MKNKNSQWLTNPEDIEKWLKKMNIKNYFIYKNLTVDVLSDVLLSNKELSFLPFQFLSIQGDFDVSYNQLTSLKGSPKNIKYEFNCSHNLLTSLEKGPKVAKSAYDCSNNQITTFFQESEALEIKTNNLLIYDNLIENLTSKEIEKIDTHLICVPSSLFRKDLFKEYKELNPNITFSIDPDYIEVNFKQFKTLLHIHEEKQILEKSISNNLTSKDRFKI